MKKISKILIAAAGITAIALVLAACRDNGDGSDGSSSQTPISSNTGSSQAEADYTAVFNETIGKFVTALKDNDIVSMELVASKTLDTYGEWSKVRVSDVTYVPVNVGKTEAEYRLTITAESVEDTELCVVGENIYTVKMAFNEKTGETDFDFSKAE